MFGCCVSYGLLSVFSDKVQFHSAPRRSLYAKDPVSARLSMALGFSLWLTPLWSGVAGLGPWCDMEEQLLLVGWDHSL